MADNDNGYWYSPFKRNEDTSIADYVTKADLDLLLNPDHVSRKFRLIYESLFYSGMRAGELLNAKAKSLVHNKHGYFIELPYHKTSTTPERTPITKDVFIKLHDYCRDTKKKPIDYIFSGQRGKHNVQWLNVKLTVHCRAVGIRRIITTHSFKKGLVVGLRSAGYGYAEIAAITRNKNLTVFRKHYDKLEKKHAYELLEKYSNESDD